MSMTAVAMVRIVTVKFRLAWKETIDFLLVGAMHALLKYWG